MWRLAREIQNMYLWGPNLSTIPKYHARNGQFIHLTKPYQNVDTIIVTLMIPLFSEQSVI